MNSTRSNFDQNFSGRKHSLCPQFCKCRNLSTKFKQSTKSGVPAVLPGTGWQAAFALLLTGQSITLTVDRDRLVNDNHTNSDAHPFPCTCRTLLESICKLPISNKVLGIVHTKWRSLNRNPNKMQKTTTLVLYEDAKQHLSCLPSGNHHHLFWVLP
jgi:hypothetical protein